MTSVIFLQATETIGHMDSSRLRGDRDPGGTHEVHPGRERLKIVYIALTVRICLQDLNGMILP